MHLVAQYKQFATDCRRVAATLTKPDDEQALEVIGTRWDSAAKGETLFYFGPKMARPPIDPGFELWSSQLHFMERSWSHDITA
jgi:hypothetical protein